MSETAFRRFSSGNLAVGLILAWLTLRRWAVALGASATALVAGMAATGAIIAAAGGWFAAHWEPSTPEAAAGSGEGILLAVGVTAWSSASAFGIFATHASTLPPSMAVLRTLPVSDREVRRAARLPVTLIAVLALAAVAPATIRVTSWASGRGVALVGLVLLVIVTCGSAWGTILLRGAGRLPVGPGMVSLRLTGAYLGWCLLVAVSLGAVLPLLRWGDGPIGLAVLAPLGWPLAWWALIEPRPVVIGGLVVTTAALVGTAGRMRTPSADAARYRVQLRPLLIAGPLPLVRVELRRMVRNPRTLEALGVAGFFAFVLVVAAGWLTRRLSGAMSPTVVALLGAQLTAAPAALSRGLSARRRPVEAALGIRPHPHALALMGAGLALAAITSLPALLGLVLLVPASAAPLWLAALPLFVTVAVLVSCAITPELGNGSAEGGAVLLYAAASTGVLAVVQRLPAWTVGPAALLVALTAIAAAVTLERAHRRPT